jgi:hypothetical protein
MPNRHFKVQRYEELLLSGIWVCRRFIMNSLEGSLIFPRRRNQQMSEIWKDPIVEDIRRVRRQIEKENGEDLERMAEKYYENQRRNPEKYVTRQPRKQNQNPA